LNADPALRNTGLDVIGVVPWGTHLCNFFETKQDLLDILIPYFKAGLEGNEFCLWITSEPISVEDAIQALRRAIPDLTRYLEKKSIEILPHAEWYLKDGFFDAGNIIQGWYMKLQDALTRGYDGMRVNGNESWLARHVWKDFIEYERELNKQLSDLHMLVLCTYSLSKSNASDILDVAHVHEIAVTKRSGGWAIIEAPEIKRTKAEIKKLNEELELRVQERTRQLNEAYRSLQASEHRFYKLFHLNPVSPMALSILKDGTYVEVNAAFTKLFGFTREQVIGKNIKDLNIWIDVERRKLFVSKIYSGETVSNEQVEFRDNDGKILHVLFSMFPLQMDEGRMVLSIVNDITDRVVAEKKLKESEESLDGLINSSNEWIWLVDKNLNLVKANKAFHQGVFQLSGHEIHENEGVLIPNLSDSIREQWNDSYGRALNGDRVVEVTFDQGLPDSKKYYLEVSLNPVKDDRHHVIGIGCFAKNITELTQYRLSLENKVMERTRELNEALGKEKELANLKARFASVVSHEFRTPLATIVLDINHLKKYKSRMGPKSIDHKIAEIEVQVQHMKNLLEDVLSVNRTSENKYQVLKRKISPAAFLEEIVEEIERLDKKKHLIKRQFKFSSLEIETDCDLLRNIFSNLLNNALKFSPDHTTVFVKGVEERGAIRVDVIDKGIGIHKADLAKIFEPFHRGTNAMATSGSGLGLSIVKSAVELLGGSISVSSKIGQGSTFSVTLPVA
jgi:PAS domain S-box-containing protein